MKRTLALLLAIFAVFNMSACGRKANTTTPTVSSTPTGSATQTPTGIIGTLPNGNVSFYKAASHQASQTVSPGKHVTYSIVLTNHSAQAETLTVVDHIPAVAEFVSGCDQVAGDQLKWEFSLAANESKTITYTLKAKEGDANLGKAFDGTATVNGIEAPCHKIYVERTLGNEDQKVMETAIDAFRQYTDFEGLNLLKMIWYVGFSVTVSYNDSDGNVLTPADILQMVYSGKGSTAGSDGSDEEAGSAAVNFRNAVIPTLYGGKGITSDQIVGLKGVQAAQLTTEALMAGDILLVQDTAADDTGKVYIYNGSRLFLLDKGVLDVDTNQALSSTAGAYRYAALRISFLIANRNDYPEPVDEQLTEAQKAVIATAEAYLLRGDRGQYDASSTMSPNKRYERGEGKPEDYTSDSWKYTNCSTFTYTCYYFALNYDSGVNYSTKNIMQTAQDQNVFYYAVTGKETAEEQKAIADRFYATLQPADIIVIRRTNDSGHALLYIGNGKIIHSTGGSYKTYATSGLGYGVEAFEATYRYLNAYSIFDPKCDSGTAYTYYPFSGRVAQVGIYRPLRYFNGSVPEETINRINNLQGIVVEKTASRLFGQTVNVGEKLTYTIKLLNSGNESKTLNITDKVPIGTTLVAAPGASVNGSNLSWQVTIPAGEKAEVSFTVMVGTNVPGNKLECNSATVGGVSVNCTNIFVANTLTTEQQQKIIAAVESLKNSSLRGPELANEIYKQALGISVNIFEHTNPDTLHTVLYEKKTGYSKYTLIANNYGAMAAPGLYGGMNFYCSDSGVHGELSRLPRDYNMIIGDLFFARSSSANSLYIYLGNGICWSLSKNAADSLDMNGRIVRAFGYTNYYAVLRPSMFLDT